jgi:hypothetical protein
LAYDQTFRGGLYFERAGGWQALPLDALAVPGILKLGFGGRACHPKLEEISSPKEQPRNSTLAACKHCSRILQYAPRPGLVVKEPFVHQ